MRRNSLVLVFIGKFTQPNVIEMADRSVIKTLSFDEKLVEYDGRIPKEVAVEVSDKSATWSWRRVDANRRHNRRINFVMSC